MSDTRSVALVTLGCTRNDVDSEELAGRLSAEGWTLVDDASAADVAVVNTCGFIEQAKKDSIDAILEANDLREHGRTQKVVAVGCLAERYGKELADELPEADAVLGFDSYTDMSSHLRAVLDWPLGSVRQTAPVTVMANVLGGDTDPEKPMAERMLDVHARFPEAKIHMYGKTYRAGRKIGHVNLAGAELERVRREARLAAHYLVTARWADGYIA